MAAAEAPEPEEAAAAEAPEPEEAAAEEAPEPEAAEAAAAAAAAPEPEPEAAEAPEPEAAKQAEEVPEAAPDRTSSPDPEAPYRCCQRSGVPPCRQRGCCHGPARRPRPAATPTERQQQTGRERCSFSLLTEEVVDMELRTPFGQEPHPVRHDRRNTF